MFTGMTESSLSSFDSSNSLSFSSYTITALDENIRQISLNTEEKPHHHINNLS